MEKAGATSRPATLAAAARERRDLVSGAVMEEGRLIRFVAGPDDAPVADLARKLPGRGLWVAADRASIQTAARKGLFSRGARRALKAPPDLADQVEALILRRLLAGLGLARKAGDLTSGFEKTHATIVAGKAALLIEASDGAADGRAKLLGVARHAARPPRLVGLFTADELGLALGGENVIHSAFLVGRGADRWIVDLDRLAGFRPPFPEHWGLDYGGLVGGSQENRGEEP